MKSFRTLKMKWDFVNVMSFGDLIEKCDPTLIKIYADCTRIFNWLKTSKAASSATKS